MKKAFERWPSFKLLLNFMMIAMVSSCFQGGSSASGDAEIRKGKKKTLTDEQSDASKNPYAGSGKATEPSEITGAWLTRCDIVEIGKALGKTNDKVLCAVHNGSGVKFAEKVDFEFYDRDGRVIEAVSQKPMANTAYYHVEYELTSEVAKTYAWINAKFNPNPKEESLDYGVLKLTANSLGGVSQFTPNDGGLPSIDSFANKKPDEAVCAPDGTVLQTFDAANFCPLVNIFGFNNIYCDMDKKPLALANAKMIDFSNGCFKLVTQSALFVGVDRYLYSGTTGCAVALFKSSDLAGNPSGFLVFSKSQLKNKVNQPDDLTFEKLRSHIEGRRCP